jgi:hypothetical protein
VCCIVSEVLGAGWGLGTVVVVVDDSVDAVDGSDDVADGGCVGIDGGDVAASREVSGCMSRVCVDVSVVLGLAWVLKSTWVVVCAFFSVLRLLLSGGSV